MNDEQLLLKDICQKEVLNRLYDIKIGTISVYSLVRRHVREEILKANGCSVMLGRTNIKKRHIVLSCLTSFWHLIKLALSPSRYSTVLLSFPRVDEIDGVFLDKFTDPIIDTGVFGDDYIIFEHGLGGRHLKPREHIDHIVYIDMIYVICKLYSWLSFNKLYKANYETICNLCGLLNNTFGGYWSEIVYGREICRFLLYIKILKFYFKLVKAKRLLGPARDYLTGAIIASRQNGMKVFELQHGITFGETTMYSGCIDTMMIPDYFLAYGDNKPLNVYGIDESRIVNIGWALHDYIKNKASNEINRDKDILVISDPEVTDEIIEATITLAHDNKDKIFHFRAHPHEMLTEEQLYKLGKQKNIQLQDRSINITIVLQGFTHILGENSTVLYEALAIHKKVGRLFYSGLHPKYLEDTDKDCFWEIYNQNDFEQFINDDVSIKKSKCIYSKFNKELLLKTIEI